MHQTVAFSDSIKAKKIPKTKKDMKDFTSLQSTKPDVFRSELPSVWRDRQTLHTSKPKKSAHRELIRRRLQWRPWLSRQRSVALLALYYWSHIGLFWSPTQKSFCNLSRVTRLSKTEQKICLIAVMYYTMKKIKHSSSWLQLYTDVSE